MKYFQRTIQALFLLLLLVQTNACTDEESVGGAPGELRLTLGIPGATVTRATDALAGESTISNIYLLFYPAGSDDAALPAFFYRNLKAEAIGVWTNTFRARDLAGLTSGTTYDVYALASLPAGTEAPTSGTTKAAFKALEEKQFDRTDPAAPRISFSGKGSYTHDLSVATPLAIDLTRTVARFDITLPTASVGVKGNVANAPLYTRYQSGETPASADRARFALMKTGDNTFRCYVYDNAAADEPVDLEIIYGEHLYTAAVQPDGANTIKRNHIYNVTLTFEVDKMVALTGNPLPWDETVANNVTPIPADIQPKANSYILAPNSLPICIPVAQANDAATFDNTVTAIAADEALTAELVWTDVQGATSKKGLAPDAAVADIKVYGTGPDAVLLVTPGSRPGNAVVAVKSGTTIRWSWHIWVTDYDPEKTEAGQNTINGYVFMDRNLGAMANTADASTIGNNTNRVVGNFYQWGRKDPFQTRTNANAQVPVYNAEGGTAATGANITTGNNRGLLVVNPFGFQTSNNYISTTTDIAKETWGENGDKTPFDPCPAGWRVPRKDAYADLNANIFPLVSSAGYQGVHTGFFPYSSVMNTNRAMMNQTTNCYNWTASGYAVTHGYYQLNASASATANYISYGLPVRCVRDWSKGKVDKEIRILSTGRYALTSAHPWGTVVSNNGLTAGAIPLLAKNFSIGTSYEALFKIYHYWCNDNTNVFPEALSNRCVGNDIDVVYVSYAAQPDETQARNLLNWVNGDLHRVLIFTLDQTPQNLKLCELLKLTRGEITGQQSLKLSDGTSAIRTKISDGVYGQLNAGDTYKTVNNNGYGTGYIEKTGLQAQGFVPILEHATESEQVMIAIHPDKRIVIIGDTQFFHTASLNADGSLTAGGNGPYPVLFANLFAWIGEVVNNK